MEVTGKVVAILQPEVFKGRNGDVTKNGFVIETEGQYPKRLKFDVLNVDLWGRLALSEGVNVNVSFDAESREWNGRWFTSLLCWRCIIVAGGSRQPAGQSGSYSRSQSPSVEAPQPQSSNSDDIPF